MKVPMGFVLGFVAGASVFSKLTDEQRSDVAAAKLAGDADPSAAASVS